jgi:hypothetical protein
MQNLTVHPDGTSPFLLGPAHARPHSHEPVLSPRPLTGRPRLSVAPPPGTVPRPTRQTSLPSLFPLATRARCTSPMSAALGPLPGTVHRSEPGPMTPPRRVAPPRPDPHLFPPLFPSATLPLSRSCCSTRPPISIPLRLHLSSARASPPLPASGQLPPATDSPLSLADSSRAPPPSATPR